MIIYLSRGKLYELELPPFTSDISSELPPLVREIQNSSERVGITAIYSQQSVSSLIFRGVNLMFFLSREVIGMSVDLNNT